MRAERREILIIEDNADIRDSLRELLEMEGYAVRTADNGRAGLDAIDRGGAPDLILLDLMMPVMDGWQVLGVLRGSDDPALAAIPVAVVSGVADSDDVCERFHCTSLRKPFDIDRLLGFVHGHFNKD